MTLLDDASAYAGIIGAILGAIAIWITFRIFNKTRKIETTQRANSQGPYKVNTEKNMSEIHSHFRDILRITKNVDLESEIDSNITVELDSHFHNNQTKMKVLLEKSRRDLDMYTDLDRNIKDKYFEIIEDFRWLIEDFFQTNDDEEVQTRIWTDNYKDLLKKKYAIENILHAQDNSSPKM